MYIVAIVIIIGLFATRIGIMMFFSPLNLGLGIRSILEELGVFSNFCFIVCMWLQLFLFNGGEILILIIYFFPDWVIVDIVQKRRSKKLFKKKKVIVDKIDKRDNAEIEWEKGMHLEQQLVLM